MSLLNGLDDMGLVIDFLERGGVMMISGLFLLLIVAAKTLRANRKKTDKKDVVLKENVIAGRKEQRVIVVYNRSNLSPSDWKNFGLTVIDLKEEKRGSTVGKEVHEPDEELTDTKADSPLVEKLEMSVEPDIDGNMSLSTEELDELQGLGEFVESHDEKTMNREVEEEPLDISVLSRNAG